MPIYSTKAIRQLIEQALSDDELSNLCCDDFPSVYQEFTSGQTKSQRVRALVEYADRHFEVPKLLSKIEQINQPAHAQFLLEYQISNAKADRIENSQKQIGWSIPNPRCLQVFGREDLTTDLLIEF